MRAIFIDAQNETVTEVEHSGKLDDFYKTLDCDLVEVVMMLIGDRPHDLWIDVEGRLNKHRRIGFWCAPSADAQRFFGSGLALQRFFGSGLVLTADGEGNCDAATVALDEVASRISFWSNPEPKPAPKPVVYQCDQDDLDRMIVIANKLCGGSDAMRDEGNRLWLTIRSIRDNKTEG